RRQILRNPLVCLVVQQDRAEKLLLHLQVVRQLAFQFPDYLVHFLPSKVFISRAHALPASMASSRRSVSCARAAAALYASKRRAWRSSGLGIWMISAIIRPP